VVVPSDQPDLLDHLSQELLADPEIEVVIDRRRRERRLEPAGQPPDDRRRAERRSLSDAGPALSLDGVVIAFRADAVGPAPVAIAPAEAHVDSDVPVLAEARARIAQWARESQGVLEAVPTVMARYRALLKVARALEGRRARLASELQTLRREHQRVRTDRGTLLRLLDRTVGDPEDTRDPSPSPAADPAWRDASADVAVLIAAVRERSERMLDGIREAKHALGLPTPRRVILCPRCASMVSGSGVGARWACLVCAWVGPTPIEPAPPSAPALSPGLAARLQPDAWNPGGPA
jgi:hypothetical protein